MTFSNFDKIAILGAGALGAFYGARLAHAGANVHFITRSDYDAVKANGYKVFSKDGDFELPHVNVYSTPEDLGPCDMVIVAIKTTANHTLKKLLPPLCHDKTTVLTLQNGLGNEDAIAEALAGTLSEPAKHVVGGISFLCSNRTAPGVINHIDHSWIRMAEFVGETQERTQRIVDLFATAEIRCEIYESLMKARWEKLVWNIGFNGLGVAAQADTSVVLNTPELLETLNGIMNEVKTGAEAQGIELLPGIVEKMINNSRSMGPYKSSMQIDYEKGRPLEVESILGEPLRRAKAAGAPCPLMTMLYAVVKRADELNSQPKAGA